MIKKFIVSFLCAIFIIGVIFAGFLFLYFSIPSREAMSSITLPATVEDSTTTEKETTENASSISQNVYVADVHQSLTLREGPSSDSNEITSLSPMTHLEVIEFAKGTDYAFVKVLTGDSESYKGYVNSEYITKLGEPTVRVGTEE